MKRLILFLLPLFIAGRGTSAELTKPWQAIANYAPDDALVVFDTAMRSADSAVAREARLGRAIALLAKQPVTAGQIDESRRLLAELAEGGKDDAAQAARFYLGRVAQHHQENPDPAEAARQFRQLIAEHESSVWAQSALSRLALLQLYDLASTDTPAQRVADAEKLLLKARVPTAEGELHIAIAEAIFYFRLPDQQALPHLLAAERLGGFDRVGRTDVLLQIAELSRLAGKKEQAMKYYRMFLQENPRDTANYTARRRLAELEGKPLP